MAKPKNDELRNLNSHLEQVRGQISNRFQELQLKKKLITAGHPTKKWLKSFEVRKLLNISHNTLANLRVNGTLPFTKIGGVIYYDYDDIQAMLTNKKVAS